MKLQRINVTLHYTDRIIKLTPMTHLSSWDIEFISDITSL